MFSSISFNSRFTASDMIFSLTDESDKGWHSLLLRFRASIRSHPSQRSTPNRDIVDIDLERSEEEYARTVAPLRKQFFTIFNSADDLIIFGVGHEVEWVHEIFYS